MQMKIDASIRHLFSEEAVNYTRLPAECSTKQEIIVTHGAIEHPFKLKPSTSGEMKVNSADEGLINAKGLEEVSSQESAHECSPPRPPEPGTKAITPVSLQNQHASQSSSTPMIPSDSSQTEFLPKTEREASFLRELMFGPYSDHFKATTGQQNPNMESMTFCVDGRCVIKLKPGSLPKYEVSCDSFSTYIDLVPCPPPNSFDQYLRATMIKFELRKTSLLQLTPAVSPIPSCLPSAPVNLDVLTLARDIIKDLIEAKDQLFIEGKKREAVDEVQLLIIAGTKNLWGVTKSKGDGHCFLHAVVSTCLPHLPCSSPIHKQHVQELKRAIGLYNTHDSNWNAQIEMSLKEDFPELAKKPGNFKENYTTKFMKLETGMTDILSISKLMNVKHVIFRLTNAERSSLMELRHESLHGKSLPSILTLQRGADENAAVHLSHYDKANLLSIVNKKQMGPMTVTEIHAEVSNISSAGNKFVDFPKIFEAIFDF